MQYPFGSLSRSAFLLKAAVALAAVGACWGAMAASAAAESDGARHDQLYTCNCGPSCSCGTVAVAAGTCDCGKALVAHHVVKFEGDKATLCTCGAGCTCEIDAADGSQCSCGKPVKTVSLKGSGLYVCSCGDGCTSCKTVSAQSGNCTCGKALKKVD